MILGVDAASVRTGGALTHLTELLRSANPATCGFSQVVVWGGRRTLARLENRPWLIKSHQRLLDGTLLHRTLWQKVRLSRMARAANCNVLLVPGGSYAGDFRPIVTMSQNVLPFEWQEILRYGLSWRTIKWLLLRLVLRDSFRRANGVMFLTQHAQHRVSRVTGPLNCKVAIVPHGVDERFRHVPREQRPISDYSATSPFQLLYVSTVDTYKHQWYVAEAVSTLRAQGFPVTLDLVGPAYEPSLRRLRKVLHRVDPENTFARYMGPVAHEEVHHVYAASDLCVFASTCENLPNALLEGMASGLPIACSDRSPMPEVLGDAGVYFDPENAQSIACAIRGLILSPRLRSEKARAGFEGVKAQSWRRCAKDTLAFLAEVATAYQRGFR